VTDPNVWIADKIVAIHEALESAGLPHAFGGALALAWCTFQARGTNDIDLNVFVDSSRSDEVFAALPPQVRRDADDLDRCLRDGQVRLWWDETPVDIFTNNTAFHDEVATRADVHEFGGAAVPFLGCTDVAVFKSFFNRGKDWVDIEAMSDAGTIDLARAVGWLVELLGVEDPRVERMRALRERVPPTEEPRFMPKHEV
jgi:hypothetical protein